MLLTHAYALWAANVLLAVFAPAFPLSFHDRKFARRPPKPIASVVSSKFEKRKETKITHNRITVWVEIVWKVLSKKNSENFIDYNCLCCENFIFLRQS